MVFVTPMKFSLVAENMSINTLAVSENLYKFYSLRYLRKNAQIKC